jgi:hypothetical protein
MASIEFHCPECGKDSSPEIDPLEPDPLITCPNPDCGFSMRVSEDREIGVNKLKWEE